MFARSDGSESRQKIIDLPMPHFRDENKYIDLHLNAFSQNALAHDLEICYPPRRAPDERLRVPHVTLGLLSGQRDLG
jgi:hypothetical protein